MSCPQRFDNDTFVTAADNPVYCEPRKNSWGVVEALAAERVALPDQFMKGGNTVGVGAGTTPRTPVVPPNGTAVLLYPWKRPSRAPPVSPMLSGITPVNPGRAASSFGST